MLSELGVVVGGGLEPFERVNRSLGGCPRDTVEETCLVEVWGEEGSFPQGDRLLFWVRRKAKRARWGTGVTNHGQVRVERIFILGAHNLVQVIGSGGARRDLVILFEDGDVVVAVPDQMEGCREAEGTASDDGNGRGFGNHGGQFVDFVKAVSTYHYREFDLFLYIHASCPRITGKEVKCPGTLPVKGQIVIAQTHSR